MAGASSYRSAKAGLHGFSRALALELAGEGIFSNVVMPGLTLTERNLENFPPELLGSELLRQWRNDSCNRWQIIIIKTGHGISSFYRHMYKIRVL